MATAPKCLTCDLTEFPLCPGPCGVDEASTARRHARAKYLASLVNWPAKLPDWADLGAAAQAAYEERIEGELASRPDGKGSSEPDPERTTPAANAIYRLQVLGTRPSSASMQFLVNGQPSDPLRTLNTWSGRSAAEAQICVEASVTVGVGNLTCTGGEPPSGTPVTFEYVGALAGTNVTMVFDGTPTFSGGAYELVTVQVGGGGVTIPAGSVRRPQVPELRRDLAARPPGLDWPLFP